MDTLLKEFTDVPECKEALELTASALGVMSLSSIIDGSEDHLVSTKDARDVFDRLAADLAAAGNTLYKALLAPVSFIVSTLPAVDAVEVVRCKDCAHYQNAGCALTYGEYEPDPEDYCSRSDLRP